MENVTKLLFEMRDPKYREFMSALIPTVDKENIIGIRSPAMKKFSKKFAKEEDRWLFIEELPHKYLEENYLHAALIPYMSEGIDQILENIERFLPYVDNWAVCDTLPPKIFSNHHDTIYPKTLGWLKSDHTYTVRFGLVTLLAFFMDDHFSVETNSIVASIVSEEYYINMAIAWYFSYALIKQYEATLPLFENNVIKNIWTHNKSIQKTVESYRISYDRKEYLRSLRIKTAR